MSDKMICPQWDYLRQATLPALQNFELSRLNRAANLKKELDTLLDEWLEETAAAMLARFLMTQSASRHPSAARHSAKQIAAPPAEVQVRVLSRTRAK